ncbi:Chromosomal replication initiator protein DnaA [Limihaloglobus sulfuriphilus]|uniref:Chromosomal replication initiator protein DnaA n=1 Tax=Limihaloglobus sulfuriphilus TaxID=1851148 RepID=A0A1Q2MCK2_9BACT|nr:chromosomal replication initiator protein DnaA [Limihaloglobus sulfuriphilus]AQQ70400.1 Chromosomal replication initiator protein DnaA [Limihaloglobus sulfuriphilus]
MASQGTQVSLYEIINKVKDLDPESHRKWFDELKLITFDGGVMQIGCPESSMVQYLINNSSASFNKAAQSLTGHLVTVEFMTLEPGFMPQASGFDDHDASCRLNPDLTFDNFVVGPCNRLAHASCVAVANNPGETYNPLFLYGKVGLGKTHLLHGICYEMIKSHPASKVSILTCEEFVNNFIKSIKDGTVTKFQSQFRNVDTLVIDDVQFLREREGSQEEFFHTFNALYESKKQIVLSGDSAPGEMKQLEERLVSRFKWGLVARIDPPTYETRIAIVQKKAQLRGLVISEDVAEFIARRVKANIRELEGALTMIYALARTEQCEIDLDLATMALSVESDQGTRQLSISDVIKIVAEYYNVKLTDLQSKSRSQSISLPRQVSMYLARKHTRSSLEEIGGHLGGRDHTTVMHACNKIKMCKENDEELNLQIQKLSEMIAS